MSATDQPLVSLLIPAYNGEELIDEALASATSQTYPRVEVIVVDDGSSDRTAEVAARHDGVTVIRQQNTGPAGARNRALAISSGEVVAFLDQDDVMLPQRLEVQVGRLLADPSVSVTLAGEETFVEEGASMPDWDRIVAPGLFGDAGERETLVNSISIVTWRRSFETIGLFDEAIFGGDDLDWLLRASEAGLGIERIEMPLLRRRIHRRNISQDTETCRMALLLCFRKRLDRRRAAGVQPTSAFTPTRPEPA
jgi:glycosyltransferase involved in cell wall biosynthesis